MGEILGVTLRRAVLKISFALINNMYIIYVCQRFFAVLGWAGAQIYSPNRLKKRLTDLV